MTAPAQRHDLPQPPTPGRPTAPAPPPACRRSRRPTTSAAPASNPTAFSVVKDAIGAGGGSVDAIGLGGTGGRYSTSTTLSLAFTQGTDGGAGLAATGAQLLRASASLTRTAPATGLRNLRRLQRRSAPTTRPRRRPTPSPSTALATATATSSPTRSETRRPTRAPTSRSTRPPPRAGAQLLEPHQHLWSGTGTAVYYRPGAASGGFTVTANSADTTSGTTSYAFPTLPGRLDRRLRRRRGVQSYSWSGAEPDGPGRRPDRARRRTTPARPRRAAFTVTPDTTAPTGGSVIYTNGYTHRTSVSVTFSKGTDAGSGVDAASGIVETLDGVRSRHGACGTFGPLHDRRPRTRVGRLAPGRHERLLPVPVPDLRQRRQPGDLHEREHRQGRFQSGPTNAITMDQPTVAASSRRQRRPLLQGRCRRLVHAHRRGRRRRIRAASADLPRRSRRRAGRTTSRR